MAITFKSEVTDKHAELARSIKEKLIVDGNSIKEEESHSAYFSNLPETLTRQAVDDVAKYNSRFVTAAHLAIGELAADVFVENKDAQEVNASIGFFGKTDNISVNVLRSKTYQNHLAKEGEPQEVTKALVMKTNVTMQSASGYGLKPLRDEISQQFANICNN